MESRRIRKEVLELSAKQLRYGYPRITALMRPDGFESKQIKRGNHYSVKQFQKAIGTFC